LLAEHCRLAVMASSLRGTALFNRFGDNHVGPQIAGEIHANDIDMKTIHNYGSQQQGSAEGISSSLMPLRFSLTVGLNV
jgi:hypothetical protein